MKDVHFSWSWVLLKLEKRNSVIWKKCCVEIYTVNIGKNIRF